MSTEIEIIPTIDTPITAQLIASLAGIDRAIVGISDAYTDMPLPQDAAMTGNSHIIRIEGNSFILRKTKFEAIYGPAIDYLEEPSDEIDIHALAADWERVGFSYTISPMDEQSVTSKELALLAIGLARSTKGALLLIHALYSWLNHGALLTAEQFSELFWRNYPGHSDI